jgi:RNA polymerase sigma factor (sigma-70 family)
MTSWSSDLSVYFARLNKGDLAARNRLLTRVWDRLVGMAKAALKRFPSVARVREPDCVANELSLKLIRRLDDGEQPTPSGFFGFAKKVLTNQMIEDTRTHRRHDRLLGPESVGERHLRRTAEHRGDELDPAAQAEWNELRERIASLPDDERRVVELHLLDNVRQSEIAQILGWPPKKVSRTWLSAVARLTGESDAAE